MRRGPEHPPPEESYIESLRPATPVFLFASTPERSGSVFQVENDGFYYNSVHFWTIQKNYWDVLALVLDFQENYRNCNPEFKGNKPEADFSLMFALFGFYAWQDGREWFGELFPEYWNEDSFRIYRDIFTTSVFLAGSVSLLLDPQVVLDKHTYPRHKTKQLRLQLAGSVWRNLLENSDSSNAQRGLILEQLALMVNELDLLAELWSSGQDEEDYWKRFISCERSSITVSIREMPPSTNVTASLSVLEELVLQKFETWATSVECITDARGATRASKTFVLHVS